MNRYPFKPKGKIGHEEMENKRKILFLCTGNSCRSQMAEAWTNKLKGDQFEAYSAGVAPKQIDPRAIETMAEAGIDISAQRSKDIDSLGDMEFDYVVTLCDNAKESCPFFPASTRLMHKGFDDPPKLAEGANDEKEAMSHYRRVRDEIRAFVEKLAQSLEEDEEA
jgi:arsenate reductase